MEQRLVRSDTNDGWYESEESTRRGMIAEIQRVRRRTRIHPIRVILLATVLTSGVMYFLAQRKPTVEAEVVLALTEGSFSRKHSGVPVDDLRDYVDNALLPDHALSELVDRLDLYPLRHVHGEQYAVAELRSHLTVEIWKNTFRYDDGEEAPNSARIGLTVSDTDPDRAYELANALAKIVIDTARVQREKVTKGLADEIAAMRDHLSARLDELSRLTSQEELEVAAARRLHHDSLVQTATLQLEQIANERKAAEKKMKGIVQSRDALADQISRAGLDLSLSIVEEHKPVPPEHRDFVLTSVGIVVGIGALLGSALLLGAFDSRVHDLEDVDRLGLPVLGHVPGFPGDDVGALATRGAAVRRVPSFERWRSHQ